MRECFLFTGLYGCCVKRYALLLFAFFFRICCHCLRFNVDVVGFFYRVCNCRFDTLFLALYGFIFHSISPYPQREIGFSKEVRSDR